MMPTPRIDRDRVLVAVRAARKASAQPGARVETSLMKRAGLPMLLCALLIGAFVPGGCGLQAQAWNPTEVNCTGGMTAYLCFVEIVPTTPMAGCECMKSGATSDVAMGCGSNPIEAAGNAANMYKACFPALGRVINGVAVYKQSSNFIVDPGTCVNTHKTNTQPNLTPAPKMPLTSPGPCDADPSDDACVACAKASCCAGYQACQGDANCSCLVACLYAGNSLAACTGADACGSLSAVSASTAACLDGSCPSQCAGMGSMGGTCSCGSSSSSSGSSGGPTCTPGSFGAGESCSSDADCFSCQCNAGTMTCN